MTRPVMHSHNQFLCKRIWLFLSHDARQEDECGGWPEEIIAFTEIAGRNRLAYRPLQP
jgi:hypothetical protein